MNVVIDCNEIFLQMVRQAAGSPGIISRSGAILHLAMFEVVNRLQAPAAPYESYISALGCVPDPAARQDLSAAYAAQRVLMAISDDDHIVKGPLQFGVKQTLTATFNTLLGSFQATQPERTASQTFGVCIADAMLAARQGDHYDDPAVNNGTQQPGNWRPTQTNTTGVTPHWGSVTPFGQWATPNPFRPSLPGAYQTMNDLLTSSEYAAQVNEVRTLGSANSQLRTAEQTEIALFWANDLDGTSKPPGQLYTITGIVARQRNQSLIETARLFALVGMAMADAAIVAWDAKYDTTIDLWRPESAIQQANTDGNTATVADPSWQPLSHTAPHAGMTDAPGQSMSSTIVTHFSPAFPAYVSGHATFGAAHAAVMRIFFGTDNITFTATTEDPNAVGVRRTFNSFTAAALENARSRVYLGVHFQWDGDNGFLSGTKAGEHIAANFLQSVPTPPVPMPMADPSAEAVS